MIKSLKDLYAVREQYLLFETVVGSRAYGTFHASSDEDLKGILILPAEHYLLEKTPLEQVSDERNDLVYYTLKRFLELAANANPNIIEMLFMPADCIRFQSDLLKPLFEVKQLFITKQVYASHVNYAQAQIKKARGKNKWVNNPQPEPAPQRKDFCWFIPQENNLFVPGKGLASPFGELEGQSPSCAEHRQKEISPPDKGPLRPMSLSDASIDLNEYHVSSVEHSQGLYRLYYYGAEAKGVFRGGELVCESIPKDHEKTHCRGLLLFNEAAYECAKRDHKNYWQWRNNRNETRWQEQESGQRDYDAKNMMHTFRLLLSGQNILEQGEPLVRFEGEKLDFLKKILDGFYTYDELLNKVEEKLDSFKEAYNKSELPEEIDPDILKNLLQKITKKWAQGSL